MPEPEDRGAEFYKVYEVHSRTLRTWLVAYGAEVLCCFRATNAFGRRKKLSESGSTSDRAVSDRHRSPNRLVQAGLTRRCIGREPATRRVASAASGPSRARPARILHDSPPLLEF